MKDCVKKIHFGYFALVARLIDNCHLFSVRFGLRFGNEDDNVIILGINILIIKYFPPRFIATFISSFQNLTLRLNKS